MSIWILCANNMMHKKSDIPTDIPKHQEVWVDTRRNGYRWYQRLCRTRIVLDRETWMILEEAYIQEWMTEDFWRRRRAEEHYRASKLQKQRKAAATNKIFKINMRNLHRNLSCKKVTIQKWIIIAKTVELISGQGSL